MKSVISPCYVLLEVYVHVFNLDMRGMMCFLSGGETIYMLVVVYITFLISAGSVLQFIYL